MDRHLSALRKRYGKVPLIQPALTSVDFPPLRGGRRAQGERSRRADQRLGRARRRRPARGEHAAACARRHVAALGALSGAHVGRARARPRLTGGRRALWAWALYDLANTTFSLN